MDKKSFASGKSNKEIRKSLRQKQHKDSQIDAQITSLENKLKRFKDEYGISKTKEQQ